MLACLRAYVKFDIVKEIDRLLSRHTIYHYIASSHKDLDLISNLISLLENNQRDDIFSTIRNLFVKILIMNLSLD
jgi:hypothetical protein